MIKLLLKLLVLPPLMLGFATAAYAGWMLLTPVTEDNVSSRMWQACMVSSGAQHAVNWGRSAPRAVFTPQQCSCASSEVIKQFGMENAVKLSETTRVHIRDGFYGWVKGEKYKPLRDSFEGQSTSAFIRTTKSVSKVCGG